MSDALQSAQVETIEFSAAELEMLRERMKTYREATNNVNEWIQFLAKQHNVKGEDGWQLGETGFVRQVAAKEASPVNRTREVTRRRKQAAKSKVVQAPAPTFEPSPNGHAAELV